MATLLDLADDSLMLICEHAGPCQRHWHEKYQLAAAISLRLTSKRFRFLEGLRYLVHTVSGYYDDEVFTSVTLWGVPDGPEYWQYGQRLTGYCEYAHGQCTRCVRMTMNYSAARGQVRRHYVADSAQHDDSGENVDQFALLLDDLYAGFAPSLCLLEFFRTRPSVADGPHAWTGAKSILVARAFPCVTRHVDPALLGPLRVSDAPAPV